MRKGGGEGGGGGMGEGGGLVHSCCPFVYLYDLAGEMRLTLVSIGWR